MCVWSVIRMINVDFYLNKQKEDNRSGVFLTRNEKIEIRWDVKKWMKFFFSKEKYTDTHTWTIFTVLYTHTQEKEKKKFSLVALH